MEQETRELSEAPARRAARIARVGARYGFGFVFRRRLIPRRRRGGGVERVGSRLRLSFEELGPTFAELGRFLSLRRDLLPTDVAAELGRASVAAKPIPQDEVREMVERELGNTLERLFVDFGRAPVRVGTFTQSHRAVLPGERPALVVVARPGVRRDVLAMRPVADLTRRRLGYRLPLNPVETATEFAAHVAHRRDMHYAAQSARRLRELEGSGLRVPDVYRDYSTARCVTFERPAEPASLGGLPAREISGALVRLAVVEGVFLADITPERFAPGTDGEVWLADPTEVFSLDPERLRGMAELLAAVRRGDVDAVARSLPLVGSPVPADDAAIRRELREALGELGGPLWREHTLAEMRDRGMEAARSGGVALPEEVAGLMGSLVAAESFGGEQRSRGSSQAPVAAEAAEELISRFRDPRYLASRAVRGLAQPDAFADYPRQVHALLDELKDGEIEVRFQHGGLDEIISKVDILANRLVIAVLVAALIVGSSLIGVFTEGGARLLGVSIFGLIGFVAAAMLGLALLVGIIRSGRL